MGFLYVYRMVSQRTQETVEVDAGFDYAVTVWIGFRGFNVTNDMRQYCLTVALKTREQLSLHRRSTLSACADGPRLLTSAILADRWPGSWRRVRAKRDVWSRRQNVKCCACSSGWHEHLWRALKTQRANGARFWRVRYNLMQHFDSQLTHYLQNFPELRKHCLENCCYSYVAIETMVVYVR